MLYVLTCDCFGGKPLIGVFDTFNFALEAMKDYAYQHYDSPVIKTIEDGHWIVNEEGDSWPYHFYIESCYPNTSLC